jgi:hypothetical protein
MGMINTQLRIAISKEGEKIIGDKRRINHISYVLFLKNKRAKAKTSK